MSKIQEVNDFELHALVRGPNHTETMEKQNFVQVVMKDDSTYWPITTEPFYVPVEKWTAGDDTVGGQKIRLFRLETEHWGKKRPVPRVNLISRYRDTTRDNVVVINRPVEPDREIQNVTDLVGKDDEVQKCKAELEELNTQTEVLTKKWQNAKDKLIATMQTKIIRKLQEGQQ